MCVGQYGDCHLPVPKASAAQPISSSLVNSCWAPQPLWLAAGLNSPLLRVSFPEHLQQCVQESVRRLEVSQQDLAQAREEAAAAEKKTKARHLAQDLLACTTATLAKRADSHFVLAGHSACECNAHASGRMPAATVHAIGSKCQAIAALAGSASWRLDPPLVPPSRLLPSWIWGQT